MIYYVNFCYTEKWLSYVCVYSHAFFFIFFSIMVCHRMLNIVLCSTGRPCFLSILLVFLCWGLARMLFSCESSEHSMVGVLASSTCPSLHSTASSAVCPLRLISVHHVSGFFYVLDPSWVWPVDNSGPLPPTKTEEEQRLRSRSLSVHSSLWVSFRPGLYLHPPGRCPCNGRALWDSRLPGLGAVHPLGPSGLGAHGFTAANPGARRTHCAWLPCAYTFVICLLVS